jgi:hypothetical protein
MVFMFPAFIPEIAAAFFTGLFKCLQQVYLPALNKHRAPPSACLIEIFAHQNYKELKHTLPKQE